MAALLPPRIANLAPHVDPDFTWFTYGDAAPRKRNQLLRLAPGDLLVFYAGLMPWPIEDIPRLFAIGWFEVMQVHNLTAQDISTGEELNSRFGNTAHFLRRDAEDINRTVAAARRAFEGPWSKMKPDERQNILNAKAVWIKTA